jgi:hypothetical protein
LQIYANLSTQIATLVATVTAPDISTPQVFNIPIQNGVGSGTITVSTGSARTVTLRAYDAKGIETNRGSTTIDVRETANPTISITLLPLAGDQPIVATLGSVIVVVTPSADTLLIGDTLRLRASVIVSNGSTASVTVRWATLNPGQATVDSGGLVTATGSGAAQIVATYGGVGGAATLLVLGANYALNFDGGDIVVIPYAPVLSPAPAMTLEFWVRFDSVPGGQYTVLKDNGTGRSYHVGLNGNNSPGPLRKVRVALHTTTGLHTVDGTTTIPFNTWTHLAETYDGSTLRLYVNGALEGSLTINEAIVPDAINLTMGNNPESFGLHGSLDEVRLWGVARTQGEIQAAMNIRLSGTESGLAGYWPLDEGSGDVVHDRSANGNHGQLGLAVGLDSADPTWVLRP